MKKFFPALALLLIALVAGGCNFRLVNMVGRAEPRAVPAVVEDERIEFDRSLRRTLRIRRVVEGNAPGGLLQVQVEVHNGRNSSRNVMYSWEWFDDAGMRVPSPLSDWRTVSLAGKEYAWLQGTAPSNSIVDFQLKLIEPN